MWYEKYLIVLLISGFVAEFILWQARGIMHNVNRNRPFCRDTVRRLRLLGLLCIVLAVFYFVAIFWVARFFHGPGLCGGVRADRPDPVRVRGIVPPGDEI